MKAMIYTQYGLPDVVHLKTVDTPTPQPNEVLVNVRAASVNISDWYALTGTPLLMRLMGSGFRQPKHTILGADIAGTVTAVGSAVTRFRPGDAVLGDLSGVGRGGFADFVAVPEAILAHKPASVSFEDAAALPLAGVTALQGLRKAGVRAGQRVLIYGASGGVGTYAIQIAKAWGAHVTAAVSPRKLEQARALGADHVIDYTGADVSADGQRYDVIAVVNGRRSLSDYQRALTPDGVCIIIGGALRQIFGAMLFGGLRTIGTRQTVTSLNALPNAADLAELAGMVAAGTVRPLIDRCYPLEEVPAALRYVGERHAAGKVVITL